MMGRYRRYCFCLSVCLSVCPPAYTRHHQWVKQGGSTWRVGLRRFFGTSNWVQNRGTSVCLTWPFFSNMEMASKPFQDVKFRRFLGKRGIMTKRGFKTKLFCTKSRRFRFYVWWWWWTSWSSWSWWWWSHHESARMFLRRRLSRLWRKASRSSTFGRPPNLWGISTWLIKPRTYQSF